MRPRGRRRRGLLAGQAFVGAVADDLSDVALARLAGRSPLSAGSEADFIGTLGVDGIATVATGGGAAVLRGVRAVNYVDGGFDARLTLQGVTDRAVLDLAANPELARGLMSRGSYNHLVDNTRLAPASYGKAVERLTARYIRDDDTLKGLFQYNARPFVSTPDFTAFEGFNSRFLDITTARSIPAHDARSYGPFTDYVIHSGLPDDLVFPPR